MFDREQAAQRAEASSTNEPEHCQEWTRTMFGAPSVGDYDGDGRADAEDGWKSEPAAHKHPGDRKPPRGVPVSYLGGSKDDGHRAVSLGGGLIRSTDAGGWGKVATVPLDWPERHWGLAYAGWSDTIDGQLIPLPPKPVAKPQRSPKHVPGAWARFAHFEPYYRNDSIDGLNWAVRHGYNAIDLNFQVTRDRVIVNTHWSQPLLHGFHDPLGKIAKNARIKDLTWREVSRLRAPGGHRIRTMNRMLAEAKKRNLRVEFEAKNSPAFTDPAIWARVNKRANQLHLSLQMKVESWVAVPGGAPAILAAAKAGGVGARIVLPRGKRILRKSAYWPVANYVRGPVIWR